MEKGRVQLAARQAADCALAKAPTECYLERLPALTRGSSYEAAAEVCARVKDPACYEAFGRLAPNPSYCLRFRSQGGYAVAACYRGNCKKY